MCRIFAAIKYSHLCKDKIEIGEVELKIPEVLEEGLWAGSIKYKLLEPLIDE